MKTIMNEYFENLCVKAITGNINEKEKTQLENWLDKDKQNLQYFEKLKSTWQRTGDLKLETNIDVENAWYNLSEKINQEKPKVKKESSNIITKLFTPKIRYSLVFTTIILVALLAYMNIDNKMIMKSESTNYGEIKELILSDGSIVKLNAGSTIQYYEEFDDERKVQLDGEAFFQIKKDERPFIIETKNAITKVLGTKFNVWSRKNETRVIVKEGKVSLANNKIPNSEVILTMNKESKILGNSKPIAATEVNAERKLGWLNRMLVFEKTNISEVAEELTRYYGVTIDLKFPDKDKLTLTGAFNKEEIDTVLTKICLALNLSYKKGPEGITITN